ncbi:MAG TPA: hypothetical protein VGS11_04490 [Candidatus Bathyarchaeia archaeon]|nr:hypothetical protein [Candidatus Bathyarchaeia archaeon]
MIDNFYQALTVCIGFIGGFLAGGWALSREVNEVKTNYRDNVDSFKALTKARFATDLMSLHGLIQTAKSGKKKLDPQELMDPTYVAKITALYDCVKQERDAKDYYESMWRTCSEGAKAMIGGGVVLATFPFLLVFYTPDQLNSFATIGVLIVFVAAIFAYAAGQRVLSYWRNRDRLLKLLGV